MVDDLYNARRRLMADLVRAKEALQSASTPFAAKQASATVEGTQMLLNALERRIPRQS